MVTFSEGLTLSSAFDALFFAACTSCSIMADTDKDPGLQPSYLRHPCMLYNAAAEEKWNGHTAALGQAAHLLDLLAVGRLLSGLLLPLQHSNMKQFTKW